MRSAPAAFLAGEGTPVTTIPAAGCGDAVRAKVAGSGGGNRPVVLMGHRDTVFPTGKVRRRPFQVADGCAHRLGAADMTAGLVRNGLTFEAVPALSGRPSVTPL